MDIGVEFTHYRVVEHIGRGGMADVWSARDKRLNRTVAIKTVARDLSADNGAEPLKLFEREAQTIAQLEHPHILPIYDFGEFEGQLYIVMRYVTGGSLENLLTNGPLDTDQVVRHARAIAGALDYAHANHVIHLDLKPSNILMDSNESPYLADFGLATVLGPEGRAANPGYGTLLYMAPEQLTAGELDHRADIYSFAILVFQMLTGELPFDATTSLALKQLQWQEDLPEADKLGSDMAEVLTPVLRRGTALNPDDRPNTMMELVTELEEALGHIQGSFAAPARGDFDEEEGVGMVTIDLSGVQTVADQAAMARQEAADIYNRARRAWSHGQGRFLLGVTHFMVMNDYYMRAEENQLEIDEAGYQMLLRGAIEYDHEIDYWWDKLDNDNRRWVVLHAIRSESAPARTRAFYRLETIPDSDPPRIPTLVAQALALETNLPAKRAAIYVLGTRAKRTLPSGTYPKVERGLTGRLLTTRTREDIQVSMPSDWRETVYNDEIDGLLAEIALNPNEDEDIRELAARTVGRIRSLWAVKMIADAQRNGTKGALGALALVRDEAPSLPSVVSPQGRIYAWLANTWRRMTDEPLRNVWRFVLAFLGGLLAMGIQVFFTFRSEAIFNAERWSKTISVGLMFGMVLAFLTLLSAELPARLRGFWPRWAQLAFSAIVGFVLGTLAWGAFTWLFLFYPPNWDVMAFGGVGLAVGLVLSAVFSLRGWLAVLLTAVCSYIPIFIMFDYFMNNRMPLPITLSQVGLLYYDYPEQIYSLAIPVVLIIAIGAHARSLWGDIMTLWRKWRSRQQPTEPPPTPTESTATA
ncbi:MAG: protein kinase [Anaerolineae bacterium]